MSSVDSPKPARRNIEIREAKLMDLRDIADIGSKAFRSDPFFNFFCTYNEDYPEDVYYWLFDELREAILAPSKAVMVAMKSDISTKKASSNKLVGWAYWERLGTDPAALNWKGDRDGEGMWLTCPGCKRLANSLIPKLSHEMSTRTGHSPKGSGLSTTILSNRTTIIITTNLQRRLFNLCPTVGTFTCLLCTQINSDRVWVMLYCSGA
jgi:hypothetical protein